MYTLALLTMHFLIEIITHGSHNNNNIKKAVSPFDLVPSNAIVNEESHFNSFKCMQGFFIRI